MLDACPHHHEEEKDQPADLDGLTPRSPRTSKPKRFWRSLDELVETKSFTDMMHREFPHAASEWTDGPSRRNFLKLMSASLALGGLTACTLQKTPEKIVPYVNPPEEVIPGRPLFFATTMPWCGYGKGVIAESHEGRPTKIEGNADHPASLGGTDVWMQASVLDLYDPERSTSVMHGHGNISTWGAFTEAMNIEMDKQRAAKGAGLRFLTGTVTSPTLARQIQSILKQMPEAKWHQWETVGRRNARDGAIAAFGQDVQTVYQIDKAKIILALDSNFLMDDPGSVVYARQFIDGRRIRQNNPVEMNRLYAVENCVTMTGAMADHRQPMKSSEIESFAGQLAGAVAGRPATGDHARLINAIADDFAKNHGKSLVVVGETQPPAVHALAAVINDAIGAAGNTVLYVDPIEAAGPDGPRTLEELAADCNSGSVDLLVILGTNPSYTAPNPLGFATGAAPNQTPEERLAEYKAKNPFAKVSMVVHHGLHGPEFDETAFFSHWHVPATHYLECWSDIRAFDGSASIIQPLIYPLYSGKSEIELMGFLAGQGDHGGLDIVRDTWKNQVPAPFEANWQRALEKGFVPGTAAKAKQVSLKTGFAALASTTTQSAVAATNIEIVFRPDPHIWDGRFANNAWLQELPKPITLLTWDNAAVMGFQTARNLGVVVSDPGRGMEISVVELKFDGRTLKLPAFIMPGHAENSVTVHLGYGRSRSGMVGNGQGGNGYDLQAAPARYFGTSLEINLADETYALATSQNHHLMENPKELDKTLMDQRELFHVFTAKEFVDTLADERLAKANGDEKKLRTIELPLLKGEPDAEGETLLPAWKYEYNKWGMVIDNNACIGCNACVIACQSENNIPVVGKEQVLRGREMHWLRIDTYFYGSAENSGEIPPDVFFQPVTCMHCENAPCELVCPVEATTHSAEGINEQTYNRCVGTRYCSNNCPYKVRRFNFLAFTDYKTPTLMLQRNPNVTVRGRGIMEKCNYCVQRVNNSRIEAKKQDRPIAPGEVVPACAQSCPTQAIFFGNLNDPKWDVTKLQDEPHRYTLLDELNTKPRTSYLARLKNPNPDLATA